MRAVPAKSKCSTAPTLLGLGGGTPLIPVSFATALGADRRFLPRSGRCRLQERLVHCRGDLDGDGDADIVTSRARGVPLVRTWLNNGTGTASRFSGLSFNPYTTKFATGAVVAAADTDGDGAGRNHDRAGAGQIATVKMFDGPTGTLHSPIQRLSEHLQRAGFRSPPATSMRDGKAEIVIGAGTGGGGLVRVFDASQGILLKEFQAYTTSAQCSGARGRARCGLRRQRRHGCACGKHLYRLRAFAGATHDVRVFEPSVGRPSRSLPGNQHRHERRRVPGLVDVGHTSRLAQSRQVSLKMSKSSKSQTVEAADKTWLCLFDFQPVFPSRRLGSAVGMRGRKPLAGVPGIGARITSSGDSVADPIFGE